MGNQNATLAGGPFEDGRVIDRGTHPDLYQTLPAYQALIDAYERETA